MNKTTMSVIITLFILQLLKRGYSNLSKSSLVDTGLSISVLLLLVEIRTHGGNPPVKPVLTKLSARAGDRTLVQTGKRPEHALSLYNTE